MANANKKRKRRFNKSAVLAIACALVFGGIGGYFIGGGHAAASNSYIENREGMEMAGNNVGQNVTMFGPPGDTYTLINRGGNCGDGDTCFQIKDTTTGHCLNQYLNGTRWMLDEANCINYAFQWFTNPPTNNSTDFGWIFPRGVNNEYGRVHGYALTENPSNHDVYIEKGLSPNNYDQFTMF